MRKEATVSWLEASLPWREVLALIPMLLIYLPDWPALTEQNLATVSS
jgi:hypothetical protein